MSAELTKAQRIEIGVRVRAAHRLAIEKGILPMPGDHGPGDLTSEAATIMLCAAVGIDYFDPETNGEFRDFTDAVQATVLSRGL